MVKKDKPILLKGMRIYTENETIENGYIKIRNQKITEVGNLKDLMNEGDFEIIKVSSDFHAVPGFLDVHIHGAAGADTMDATKEALDTMAAALPKEGTTSFLATTITQESEFIERALENAGQYILEQPEQGQAEVIGIHLEGPFINPDKAGAQPVQHIIEPNLAQFQEWQRLANGMIKLVTLAPEMPGALEMIRYLKENGIVASIGHTDATFEQVNMAVDAGASHVTHLFNQMRGLHHREPGVVGAVLLHDELKAELIVDGIHVHPAMVKLAYQQKQRDGLILITDAMRAKCLKNGHYDLGGQDVKVEDGKAVLADGTLAGSILRLGDGLKNIMAYTGCSLRDAIEMAAANPAKQLKIYDRKGSIKKDKDADIVILDEQMNVVMTICRGAIAFSKEEM